MDSKKHKLLLALMTIEDEDDDDIILASMCLDERSGRNNLFKRRKIEGTHRLLILNHLNDDEIKFREYFRLTRNQFQEVLNLISADIQKFSTNSVQQPITPSERLAVTLRYLATGESFRSLAFAYRISHNHISAIVREVLEVICRKLVPIHLPKPTKNSMLTVAKEFYELWNFPNCCGAVDGKHCRIVCPENTGSLYFNYKSFFSIVLLAIVDAKYKFICIDVGSYGKEGDSGIFKKSKMGEFMSSENHCIPEDAPLPGTNLDLPHVIIGDEAFQLSRHMLRPYPRDQVSTNKEKRVFNYRLCRARRTVENAFGILCQTFRIFFTPIAIQPKTADLLITACCCLHNLIRNSANSHISEEESTLLPNKNMISLTKSGGNASTEAFQVREEFKNYFCSQHGSVQWQEKYINRTDKQ